MQISDSYFDAARKLDFVMLICYSIEFYLLTESLVKLLEKHVFVTNIRMKDVDRDTTIRFKLSIVGEKILAV